MGMPMCANLVRAGFEVLASDRRAELEAPALSVGARWAADTGQAAADADVLITMLPGPAEVHEVASAALDVLHQGATWIDMSTVSPKVGEALADRVAARGVSCIDAPVAGGAPAAETATLQLFVGGDTAVVEQRRALLEVFGEMRHVGPYGSGHTTKLIINTLWFGQAVVTAEALLLARRAGLDLEVVRQALAASSAASEFVRHDLDALLAGDYMESFALDRVSEQLDGAAELARDLAVPFEVSELVARIHRRAVERFGQVDGELLAVALLEDEAGLTLRQPPE
jgi:3-hydroxyisobutyrate dehydrogenase